MAKSEKIDYLLEQVRLCLDMGDYVRAQILSRKVGVGRGGVGCRRGGVGWGGVRWGGVGVGWLPWVCIRAC
jgi:hypothetical protein